MRRHLASHAKCKRRQEGDPETENEQHVSCPECIHYLIAKRKETAVQ